MQKMQLAKKNLIIYLLVVTMEDIDSKSNKHLEENVIKEIFQVFEVTIHFFSLYLAANINAQIQNV